MILVTWKAFIIHKHILAHMFNLALYFSKHIFWHVHHSGFGYYPCYISKHFIREVGGSFDMVSKKFAPLSLTLPCWPVLQQSFVKNLFLKFSGILRKNYGKCLPPKEISCRFKFENQPFQDIVGKVAYHDHSQILQK